MPQPPRHLQCCSLPARGPRKWPWRSKPRPRPSLSPQVPPARQKKERLEWKRTRFSKKPRSQSARPDASTPSRKYWFGRGKAQRIVTRPMSSHSSPRPRGSGDTVYVPGACPGLRAASPWAASPCRSSVFHTQRLHGAPSFLLLSFILSEYCKNIE